MFCRLLIALLTLVAFVNSANAALIAHYEFEGDLYNSIGFFVDGEAYGNVGYGTSINGQALSLDGDSYALFRDMFLPVGTGTVSMNVNISSLGEFHNGGISDYFYPAKNNFRTVFAYNFPGDYHHVGDVTMDMTTDQWVNYTFVYENGQSPSVGVGRVYINGTYEGQDTGYINNHAMLAGDGIFLGREFIGLIDDLRIYDHALSYEEIQQISSVPVPAAVWLLGSGLVGLMGIRRKMTK